MTPSGTYSQHRSGGGGAGSQHGGSGGGRSGGGGRPPAKVFFDPSKPEADLYDSIAEEQADSFPSGRDAINKNQMRKFFSDIKDLYRRYEARIAGEQNDSVRQNIFQESIEPQFRMMRSKVNYATRAGGKIPKEFADFLTEGIRKVEKGNHEHFCKFVLHFEAVVGFMYGKGKVSS